MIKEDSKNNNPPKKNPFFFNLFDFTHEYDLKTVRLRDP